MGWSCSRDAAHTLDHISQLCIRTTGSSNVFMDGDKKYMFETGREQGDGAICATVYKFIEGDRIKPTTSLRIEPDGRISRGLACLKRLPIRILVIGPFRQAWDFNKWGEPTDDAVRERLQETNDSYKPGGLNGHVSKARGQQVVYSEAKVVDLDGNTVAEHKHGMFQVV